MTISSTWRTRFDLEIAANKNIDLNLIQLLLIVRTYYVNTYNRDVPIEWMTFHIAFNSVINIVLIYESLSGDNDSGNIT